ncbi:putative AMFR protein [Talaromyces proteolyticus]|uniref:Coupling of ubiquitin conjugation to ER degradation protein 1 n=1 Tax=Talaromyces proteolyticus TaxID=1131652 RepID=A0AAD4PVG9_9EURO|nr:putative AMFR protein [Talaromyces proteolyticus]KAH8691343.1 putative AMFR protein [Talaromyces proteolyticus]
MAEEEPSVNIPSLLTLAVVSFFVIRWFLNRDGAVRANGSGRPQGRIIDQTQVEQISQMFPQLNRRDIMWDLQRNGGSVAATTERILTGRGLDTPPPAYQPHIPQSPHPASATVAVVASKTGNQDLISRYNLSNRLSEETEANSKTESGWAQNKNERQRLLQKRRDDMILAARRKLQQKERETSHATGPAL